MMKSINLILILTVGCITSCGIDEKHLEKKSLWGLKSQPQIIWEKEYGDSSAYSIQPIGNGYILCGNQGNYISITKLDHNGNRLWINTYYLGVHRNWCKSIKQTNDGGYVATGIANVGSFRPANMFVLKTDSNGNEQWFTLLPDYTSGESIHQVENGNYVAFGSGIASTVLAKLDSNGNELSREVYLSQSGYSGQPTADGYIITGVWLLKTSLLKIDQQGNQLWLKQYEGDSGFSSGYSVKQTNDGGYIVAGTATVTDKDFYLLKTDIDGNEEWSKIMGGIGEQVAYDVQQTTDNGYIFIGKNNSQSYVVKTNEVGDEEWSVSLGAEEGRSIQQTNDSGFITCGNTRPNSQYITRLGFRTPFKRADANSDNFVDISDVITILDYLFTNENPISCMKTADINDSGEIDISDPIYLLQYLFSQGPLPKDPFGECGFDLTEDMLSCDLYECSQ